LISMIGLSRDEDTFCLYAAPLLVQAEAYRVRPAYVHTGGKEVMTGFALFVSL